MTYEEFINSLENKTEDLSQTNKFILTIEDSNWTIEDVQYSLSESINYVCIVSFSALTENQYSVETKDKHLLEDWYPYIDNDEGLTIATMQPIKNNTEDLNQSCEECGGIGHTIGFLGSQKVVYPCEKGCAQ